MNAPLVSIVVPVYNEEAGLQKLFDRLYPALDALRVPYECVFVDDGSRDRSVALLRAQFQKRPAETRVIVLQTNFGQHAAILAGFEKSRGAYVVTLDADLQNPPEEIGKIVAEMQKGHDYVGTWRANRQDVSWRRFASRLINALRERTTPIRMEDHGCMMRGYGRPIVNAIVDSPEAVTFIPALAALYSGNPVEIEVKHEERAAGESKYSVWKLARLNFDLMTGFSIVPLQIFSIVGLAVSGFSAVLVLYLAYRRIFIGPESEGVFTLFAIAFFFLGIALIGIGLLGEYVGRIYVQVRGRPRYLIGAVLEQQHGAEADAARAIDVGAAAARGSDRAPDTMTIEHR